MPAKLHGNTLRNVHQRKTSSQIQDWTYVDWGERLAPQIIFRHSYLATT